jgi:hypothetical protein
MEIIYILLGALQFCGSGMDIAIFQDCSKYPEGDVSEAFVNI